MFSGIALSPGNAVSAIIVTDEGRYLMQLRDNRPDIFFPDHWGLFGGAVDEGEGALEAFFREIKEELHFTPEDVHQFTSFDFDLNAMGRDKVYRTFFEVCISEKDVSGFVLGEGVEMRLFKPEQILMKDRVVPYDSFAIWLHAFQHRLTPASVTP